MNLWNAGKMSGERVSLLDWWGGGGKETKQELGKPFLSLLLPHPQGVRESSWTAPNAKTRPTTIASPQRPSGQAG